MQLVAYGAQDIYLTGNPQITFFKVVYRRHTNFALEAIEQTFNGTADFGKRVTVTISRNGDLINRTYLQIDIPAVTSGASDDFAWTRHLGNTVISYAEVEIGGQRIDKHYGEWLTIWSELTILSGQIAGYNEMIGNTSTMFTAGTPINKPAKRLYVPLYFWFNRNPGLSLPLIALQYHEVKINIEFRAVSECFTATQTPTSGTPSFTAASLYVDYVYLDTDERRRFAQVSHEYLIEQLQFTGAETLTSTSNKIRLNFNHPVKEIIWVARRDVSETANEWTNFTDATGYAGNDPLTDAKLQLNGHDRFSTRQARYFNLVQPFQHHSNIPVTGIYVYSFGLKPEEHQPSGTANLSRIDNATFVMTFASALFTGGASINLLIYATNYNVLRIMSGMGGLAYSN
jgi:hypothetical protein